MAQVLDGKVVRDEIAENLKLKIENLKLKPKLVIIQVGDNPESNAYIGQKIKFGEKIGAIVELKKFPADISQDQLTPKLQQLNSDSSVHGIIIQLPITDHLDKEELIELIDPKKDVDGLTTTNQKLLEEGKINKRLITRHPRKSEDRILDHVENDTAFIPATAKGVISILNFYKIPIKGKKATVVGRSKLVGAPVASLLRNLGAEVTVGHSKTEDLTAITKPADIIVVAVGKPNLIGKEHVSPGQTVVDVGINVVEEKGQALAEKVRPLSFPRSDLENQKRKLVGDVNFQEVEPIVKAITPVPGGVGPMTVASLYENLLDAYKKQNA